MSISELDTTDTMSDDDYSSVDATAIRNYIVNNEIQNPTLFFGKLSNLLEHRIYSLTHDGDVENPGHKSDPESDEEIPINKIALGMQKGFETVKVIVDKNVSTR